MNGFDLSTISGLYVGSTPYSAIYKGSVKIWEVNPGYSSEYFTIESLEDNNDIIFQANDSYLLRTIEVSTDKTNWISYTSSTGGTTLATLNTGDKLYVRGSNDYYATSTVYNYFTSSKYFNVSGNIMSLCYGDNFVNQTTLPGTYTFYYLFGNCTKLVDISNLILPAITLTPSCYRNMFNNCTSLTTAPELPATTLADFCYSQMFYGCTSLVEVPELSATILTNRCYNNMFRNCTSLTTAPELPATTLVSGCYLSMFYGCTSLTTAPELPATTLADYCYFYMFYGCTSLTTAPELPATTLADYCYYFMFQNCTSLNYVKALFTTDISSTTAYTNNWLYNVAATGTFVKSKDATWSKTGESGIPSGWRVTTI